MSVLSRMLVWPYRPIHLLSVHFSRFDMLTPGIFSLPLPSFSSLFLEASRHCSLNVRMSQKGTHPQYLYSLSRFHLHYPPCVLSWLGHRHVTITNKMCRWQKGSLPEKTLFVLISKGTVINALKLCPNVSLLYQNSASSLSQLHLSVLTGSTQRAGLCFCVVR